METSNPNEPPSSAIRLRKKDLERDPVEQFRKWFTDASRLKGIDATAMILSTATRDARPSARVVLLKYFDEHGFTFFTNYRSRKSRELQENPQAALVFYWEELARQIRIVGRVERVDADLSDTYFQSRPRGSQIGAWVSPQSEVIASRSLLEDRLDEAAARFGEGPVERPPHWGGYRVVPDEFEFWLGGSNRLHDRFRYTRDDSSWKIDRLGP